MSASALNQLNGWQWCEDLEPGHGTGPHMAVQLHVDDTLVLGSGSSAALTGPFRNEMADSMEKEGFLPDRKTSEVVSIGIWSCGARLIGKRRIVFSAMMSIGVGPGGHGMMTQVLRVGEAPGRTGSSLDGRMASLKKSLFCDSG